MIYDNLKYSHVVYTCKFCDKKWDFTSHFFMGDVLGNFALKTILIAALQIVLYPLYLLLIFLSFES